MDMMKLITFADKKIREELSEDYYFISKSRLDNLVHCFESGAERIAVLSQQVLDQQKEINRLTRLLLTTEDQK